MQVDRILRTSAGNFPLDEYRLKMNEREWKILHISAVLSREQESHFLLEMRELLPYGVTLWASGIALAHEIAARGEKAFTGKQVLELGSGTGLPGIVAASLGAQVIQTDRNELAMSVCKRNVKLNNVETTEQRLADWMNWNDNSKYDWILGSDILYSEEVHTQLHHIFESNLKPDGKILLSDPFREASLNLLEKMEEKGWLITMSKWSIGENTSARPVGIFELTPL